LRAHPASRSRRSGSGSNDRVSGSTSGPERSSAILIEPGSSGSGSAYGPFVEPSPSLGSPCVDTPDQSMMVGNGWGSPASRSTSLARATAPTGGRSRRCARAARPRTGGHDRDGSREHVIAIGRDPHAVGSLVDRPNADLFEHRCARLAVTRACARTVRSAMHTPPCSCSSTGVPGAITSPGHRSIVASGGEPRERGRRRPRAPPRTAALPRRCRCRRSYRAERSPDTSSSSRQASSAGPAIRT
jgi:hypothetical protein